MTSLGIDVQNLSAYHPSGNGLAEQAISELKIAIKKNGVGNSKDHLQQLVTSFNNASSSVPGAQCAAECLLGFKPRYDLPRAVTHMSEVPKGGHASGNT